MTYQELFDQLTPEQLQQPIVFCQGDDGIVNIVESVKVSTEDMYFDHADCCGNLLQVQADELDADDLTKVPAGTVTLHD